MNIDENELNEQPVEQTDADNLQTPEAIAALVDEALQTGDAEKIAEALGAAVQAKGLAAVAEQTGISPEQLQASLCQGSDPTFAETTAVMRALGIRFAVEDQSSRKSGEDMKSGI